MAKVAWTLAVAVLFGLSVRADAAPVVHDASADAVYSNLGTFRNQSYAAGGATQQLLNTITRMAADDLNLAGTAPYSVNGFRFTVTNLNTVDVSASPLVRFYLADGPGGAPGTLIAAFTYNPIVFTAGRVGTIKTSTKFVLPSSSIWAGIVFDNNGGATGATAEQLDNLAQGIFSPAELGTSTDQYFVTTAAGSFAVDNPSGTLTNFGGAPPADFGWEILTAQDVDLSITKSDSGAPVFAGGSVVYTITASNAGPDPVSGARVVDQFPPALTCNWTCAGNAGNACAATGSGNINDETVDLAAGGSVTYTATCAVSTIATGSVMNTATIFAPGTAVEANVMDNSATNSVTLSTMPPTIAKAFGQLAILVGGTTTLTFTLTNPNAASALTGIGFTDSLPPGLLVAAPNGLMSTCIGSVIANAGTGSISLSIGTLAAGASCTIAADVTGTASGLKANTTNAVTSIEGGTGATAVAFLVVVSPPAVAPPTIAKVFGAASVPVNASTTLTFTLTNPNPGTALSGVNFTDTLPAGLVVATPNGLANPCAGTATAVAASGSIMLADGDLPASGSCTIVVSVTGTTAGVKNNNTSPVTSTEGGSGGTAAANLTVVTPPAVAKAFGASSIVVNGTTTLTFTLTNPNPATALTGVGFIDMLPAGLVIATPNALANTCGGAVTAVAGAGSIALTSGGIPGNGSCTITVNVTGATAGNKNNITSPVTSTEGGTGGTATASVIVVAPPTIAKSFAVASIDVNATTTLTFTLVNPNAATALSGVGFTDALPSGLVVATPNSLASTCAGIVTALAATGSVELANATLPASGSCTIAVNVTGATAGVKNNVTSPVTSTEGGTGGTAAASLTVVAPPTIAKFFGTATIVVSGTTTLTFTLVNPNAATALNGVGFTDTLPAGLVVATPNGLASTCGGNLTAVAAAGSVALTNASLPANSACTITVNVTGTTAGTRNNITSPVTTAEGGMGGTAAASLTVVGPPTIEKSFGAASIDMNATTTLTFTITNPAGNGAALTAVSFTDPLPPGLVVTTPISGSCGGGTITATEGAASISLAEATLDAGTSCVFTINVLAVAAGTQFNTTSTVTSANGGAGNAATASITVLAPVPFEPIPTLSMFALAILALVVTLIGVQRMT